MRDLLGSICLFARNQRAVRGPTFRVYSVNGDPSQQAVKNLLLGQLYRALIARLFNG